MDEKKMPAEPDRPVPQKDRPIRLSSLDDLTEDNIDEIIEHGGVINLRSLRRELEGQ